MTNNIVLIMCLIHTHAVLILLRKFNCPIDIDDQKGKHIDCKECIVTKYCYYWLSEFKPLKNGYLIYVIYAACMHATELSS